MKKYFCPRPQTGATVLVLKVNKNPEASSGALSPHDQALCEIQRFYMPVPENLPEPIAAACALGMFYLSAHPEKINSLTCRVFTLAGRELSPSCEFDCVEVAESYAYLLGCHEG